MAKIDNCTKIRAALLYFDKKYTYRSLAEGLKISKSSAQRYVEEYKTKYIPDEIERCKKRIEWIKNTKVSEKYYSAAEKKKDILELETEIDLLIELNLLKSNKRM